MTDQRCENCGAPRFDHPNRGYTLTKGGTLDCLTFVAPPADTESDPIIDIGDGHTMPVSDLFQAPPPDHLLSTEEIRRIGAMNVGEEGQVRSHEVDVFLDNQRHQYQAHSKDALIEELLRRDRNALVEGRNLADGKTAGRLLREFVRGVLNVADYADLRKISATSSSKAGLVEHLLQALGADPADARELKRHGHMLGTGQTSEEAEAEISNPSVPQFPSPRVADDIRQHRREHTAGATDDHER